MLKKILVPVIVCVALVGCGRGSKDSATSPTSSSSVPADQATSSSSSSSSSSSTSSTSLPKLSVSSKLTVDGLGPLVIDARVADISTAAGLQIVETPAAPAGDACAIGVINGGPAGVSILTVNHVIKRVDVKSGSVKTLSGIGIGSTEDDVKRTYPSATSAPHKYVEGGHYMRYVLATQPTREVLFETDGKKVTAFRSGEKEQVEYVEGCL